jgi:hypothetical protein
MTEAIKTIQFNTGRKYTAEGQIVTATLYADGTITFYDSSRMVDGEFKLPLHCSFNQTEVMHHYDAGTYQRSKRSHADGLFTYSRNTRDGFDALTKLEALPKPEAVKAKGGLIALDNLLHDFCGSLGFARASADELLAFVSGNRTGEVNRLICEWLMGFIIAYDGDEPDPKGPAYRIEGDDKVELFAADTQRDCINFVAGYTSRGDWGGHSCLALIETATGDAINYWPAPEQDEPEAEPAIEWPAAQYPDHLDAGEREIIDAILKAALEAGYTIRIHDEEGPASVWATEYDYLTSFIAATGDTNLFIRMAESGKPIRRVGFIQFIHGNMPYEVVADSTDSAEITALIDAAQPIIDRLEAEAVGAA